MATITQTHAQPIGTVFVDRHAPDVEESDCKHCDKEITRTAGEVWTHYGTLSPDC